MARVALVTGGTRGIGAEISVALQAAGRTVVAIYASNFKECSEGVAKIVAEVPASLRESLLTP